jgi:hypothetical protein
MNWYRKEKRKKKKEKRKKGQQTRGGGCERVDSHQAKYEIGEWIPFISVRILSLMYRGKDILKLRSVDFMNFGPTFLKYQF